jgi:hypothetical protein
MKSLFDTRTTLCLVVGFALQVSTVAYAVSVAGQPVGELVKAVVGAVRIIGIVAFIAGVGFLAQNKGRSGFLGALGLLSLLGLAIVLLMPRAEMENEKTA